MSAVLEFAHSAYGEAIGLALAHFVWQGALLGVAAWVSSRVLQRGSPRLRYAVACLFLGTMLAAFLASFAMLFAHAASTSSPPAGMAEMATGAFTIPPRAAHAGENWTSVVVIAWLAGIMILGVRTVGGWALALWEVTAGRIPASAALRNRSAEIARRLQIRRRSVRVFESCCAAVPMTIGVLRPIVLLPATAVSGLTAEQLEAVIAHELAHVARFDFLVNCVQTLVEIVLFFHPAVWWLSARIREEREMACDASAVALSGDPVLYSHTLLALEHARQPFALAATGGDLKRRVEQLVRPADHNPATGATALITLFAAGASIAAGLLAWQAKPNAAFVPQAPVSPAVQRGEIERRIAYANERFADDRPGADTDRGRAYIAYGPPSEMEVHPAEHRQVWRYGNGRMLEFAGPHYDFSAGRQPHGADGYTPALSGILMPDLPEALRRAVADRLSTYVGNPLSDDDMSAIRTVIKSIDPSLILLWGTDPATGNVILKLTYQKPEFGLPTEVPFDHGRARLRLPPAVMNAKLVYAPEPDYPDGGRTASPQGLVRLSVLVGVDGSVKDVRYISGHPLLVERAKVAALRRKYEPTVLDGKPVEVVTPVVVRFRSAEM